MSTAIEELLPLLARLSEVDGELETLADLAAADGRSPFHLQRVFQMAVGESPAQFQSRVRLQRAAASLLVTSKTVLEVALDAGFESHGGFTRAFKRRFGLAPKEFRGQRPVFEQLVQQYRTHLETAQHAAPCVGLYRVTLDPKPVTPTPGGDPMSYEVAKRTIEEVPFLYVRRSIKQEEIAEALGAMFGAVFQYATANGIPFAGPPTARYPSFGPGLITLEAGMPVAGAPSGEGEILLGSLCGGSVATTVHKGAYDRLNEAHEAMQNWLAEQGEQPSGGPWEVYLTDPGEVPDPADWLTEINWPLG